MALYKKKFPISPKKIPYYFLLFLLTVGASLLLGFLSFSGMYVLIPALSLAFTTFALSVAYEAEIYVQNIKNAYKKLFKKDYLQDHLAKKYLLNYFPKHTYAEDCPQFFKDYENALKMLGEFGHKRLKEKSRIEKKRIEKKLTDLERIFASLLFEQNEDQSANVLELKAWIEAQNQRNWAKKFLLDNYSETTEDAKCPRLIKEYAEQQNLLKALNKKKLTKEEKQRKKGIEQTLADIEQCFALKAFSKTPSKKEQQLKKWLGNEPQNSFKTPLERLKERRFIYNWVKGFCLLAGTFMTLGSTYLIVEAFSVIPVMAAIPFVLWPAIIIPMALIAGAAYGMLTFNTITDLINNNTLQKWRHKIINDLKQGLTWRNLLVAATAFILVSLAIALTICTAGTWWTIATHARPLFEWMGKMPPFIMGIMNPTVVGVASTAFGVENSLDSLEIVDKQLKKIEKKLEKTAEKPPKKNIIQRMYDAWKKFYKHWDARENHWQKINLFRLLLKLLITPLRILFFLGHLASIALNSDQIPSVPKIISILIGFFCEGFEDLHYFFGHGHDHSHHHKKGHHKKDPHYKTQVLLEERHGAESGHNHVDIPSFVIQYTIGLPFYLLSTLWDWLASQQNKTTMKDYPDRRVLKLKQAWNKQRGVPDSEEVAIPEGAERTSNEWQVTHTIYLIDKHEKKHLDKVWIGDVTEKKAALHDLKDRIRETQSVAQCLESAQNNPAFKKHRLFAGEDEPTKTELFIEELPQRVNAVVIR